MHRDPLEPPAFFGLALVVVVGGAAVAYLVSRSAGQPEVSAGALPLASMMRRAAVFVDCSKIDSVAYFSKNPWQTFVLVNSEQFASAVGLLDTERRHLRVLGWLHSAAQPLDYDGVGGGMATVSQSWVSPDRRSCAFVTTAATGAEAEGREILPYDPYNQPHGVLAFYRTARAVRSGQALWIRLRPAFDGRCVGWAVVGALR